MMSKNILNASHKDAKKFFMRGDSYVNFDLPKYFDFSKLLNAIDARLKVNPVTEQHKSKDYENVNYKLLSNKDGKYEWRPLEIIHPVLYLQLVNVLTESANWKIIKDRFKALKIDNIECASLPIIPPKSKKQNTKQISNWWQNFEQESIKQSLSYGYVLKADITNCYGSIYTHSIVWALHTKDVAKSKKTDETLLGNNVDKILRNMQCGETNSIPQGSVLMDFIAEIVLAQVDFDLAEKLNTLGVQEYKILRYRDDYNIFTNNIDEGKVILKTLTEVLYEFKMKLNAKKSQETNDIVSAVIKPDKIQSLFVPLFTSSSLVKRTEAGSLLPQNSISPQKQLLQVYAFSKNNPNSGSMQTLLTAFRKKINDKKSLKHENIEVLVAICVSLVESNPRCTPNIVSIISRLIDLLPKAEKLPTINKILAKLSKIPNTGYFDIWMQRMAYKIDPNLTYECMLTETVKTKDQTNIWDNGWLQSDLIQIIKNNSIIVDNELNKLSIVISVQETELFKDYYEGVTLQ